MRPIAILVLAVFAAGAVAAPPARNAALPAAEWNAIQQVIGEQLTALKAGDGVTAINYALPDLRPQFGTPDRFLRMVQRSFSALLEARASTFLKGDVVDGVTIQPLQLVLPDSSVVVAFYRMRKKDGRWYIEGCQIAPSTAQAT
jgi:Domain of unknown function (DUF4864)